jgi:hypothetical protein
MVILSMKSCSLIVVFIGVFIAACNIGEIYGAQCWPIFNFTTGLV